MKFNKVLLFTLLTATCSQITPSVVGSKYSWAPTYFTKDGKDYRQNYIRENDQPVLATYVKHDDQWVRVTTPTDRTQPETQADQLVGEEVMKTMEAGIQMPESESTTVNVPTVNVPQLTSQPAAKLRSGYRENRETRYNQRSAKQHALIQTKLDDIIERLNNIESKLDMYHSKD